MIFAGVRGYGHERRSSVQGAFGGQRVGGGRGQSASKALAGGDGAGKEGSGRRRTCAMLLLSPLCIVWHTGRGPAGADKEGCGCGCPVCKQCET